MVPKILMLGWEYPPVFAGGLGIATQAIFQHLGKHLPVRLVLPDSRHIASKEAENIVGLEPLISHSLNQEIDPAYQELAERFSYVAYQNPQPILLGRNPFVHEPEPTSLFLPQKSESLYGSALGLRVITFAQKVLDHAHEWDFDIIHAHDWMTFLAGIELKAQTGKSLILHVHSLESDRMLSDDPNPVSHLEQKAFDMADKIVVVSQYSARKLQQYYQVDASKIKVVYNGITHRSPQRLPKPFPETLIVFLGRLTAQKDPFQFLSMAGSLLEKEANLRFMLAGAGDQWTDLIEAAAMLKMGDRFHHVGFLDQKQKEQLLGMADVLVMPSRSEPFGLVALEATQMGVPCVISKEAGVFEVLSSAVPADPNQPESWVEAVLSLIRSEEQMQSVVEKGQKELKKLSWDQCITQLISLYQSLNIQS